MSTSHSSKCGLRGTLMKLVSFCPNGECPHVQTLCLLTVFPNFLKLDTL